MASVNETSIQLRTSLWRIDNVTVKLEEFVDPTTSMYFFIVDVNNPTASYGMVHH